MKLIAYHLPQFHAIPENDEWWGKGFTEWTNTRKTKPLWRGHNQPREPHDGNYYDLSEKRTRDWQAELAKRYGIHGFCYYHYWFKGRRLLERPVEALLSDGSPDFPFCLAWANESWSRTWSEGGEHNTLMSQTYGEEADWREHYDCLRRFFLDPRYLRVDGRPMILIYRANIIPCLDAMLNAWRRWAEADGLGGLYVVGMMSVYMPRTNPTPGLDAFQEFEPMTTLKRDLSLRVWAWRNLRHRLRDRLGKRVWLMDRYSYDGLWKRILRRTPPDLGVPVIPGAFVDWDNTARSGLRGMALLGATPAKFRRYLSRQIDRAKNVYRSDMLFINAWNEWAEGTYLEPDTKNGHQFLDAVADALADNGIQAPVKQNAAAAR